MTEGGEVPRCLKCRQGDQSFRHADFLERIRLADDPADSNCGHFYLETVHILQCPACGHRQEHLQKRTPYATLREAQSSSTRICWGRASKKGPEARPHTLGHLKPASPDPLPKGRRMFLHRPHPGREAKRYQVEEVRAFLQSVEVTP